MENVTDNEEEQTRDIYAHFGLAIYLAQVLEHGIVNAMVILRLPEREKYTRSDIDKFMEGEFRKTLGTLIAHLRQMGSVDSNLEVVLSDALAQRNYLAHYYFREKFELFYTQDGRNQMIAGLKVAQQLFSQADKALAKTVAPIGLQYGLTEEVIEDELKKMIIQIRSGVDKW